MTIKQYTSDERVNLILALSAKKFTTTITSTFATLLHVPAAALVFTLELFVKQDLVQTSIEAEKAKLEAQKQAEEEAKRAYDAQQQQAYLEFIERNKKAFYTHHSSEQPRVGGKFQKKQK